MDQGPLEVVPRWMVNPDWAVPPGCQAKLIWLEDIAEAVRLTGAVADFLPALPPGFPAYVGIAHDRVRPRASVISRRGNKLARLIGLRDIV